MTEPGPEEGERARGRPWDSVGAANPYRDDPPPIAHAATASKGRKGRSFRDAATRSLGGRANIIQVAFLLEIIILSARSPELQKYFQLEVSAAFGRSNF
jgi:hypothetical protein